MAVGTVPGVNLVPITAFDGVNQCCLGGQLLLEGGPDKFHPLLASESLGAITAAQKDHFDGLSFAIVSSVELYFTNDHTIDTSPTVWAPQKLQGIMSYVMCTRCTQKHLTWSLLYGRNGPLFS
jgi:hypothetical protein